MGATFLKISSVNRLTWWRKENYCTKNEKWPHHGQPARELICQQPWSGSNKANKVNASCYSCVCFWCYSLLTFSIYFNVCPLCSSHAPEKRSSCPNRAGSHSSFIIDDFTFMFCNYILVYSPIAFDKWVYFITMSHHSQIKVFIIILSFEKGFINL